MKKRCHGKPPANCCDDGSLLVLARGCCGAGRRPYVFSIHVQNEGNEERKKNPFLHLLFVLRPVPKFCRESSAFSSVCIFTTSLTLERFWFCRASLETNAVVFGCKASFLGLGVGADLMRSTQPGPSGRSAPAKHGMDPHHHRELWACERAPLLAFTQIQLGGGNQRKPAVMITV